MASISISPPLTSSLRDSITCAPPPQLSLETGRLLPSEASFRATLRSCVGGQCLTAVPPGSPPRIALLAPPSDVADALWRWYEALVRKGDKKLAVSFARTSAAPPYGYGKNHGYTRIVRLALPLLASAAASGADAARAPAFLKQHVRWHCRVSHVVACVEFQPIQDTFNVSVFGTIF